MRRFFWLAALALLAPAPSPGAEAPKKRGKAPVEAAEARPEAGEKPGSPYRPRFEAYLKHRLSKINEHHKARLDFHAKEGEVWQAFWGRVKEERDLFEIRITRQILALFESLALLDPKDHAPAISDFEKMHATVTSRFESQHKQKIQDFFAQRDARWRQFAEDEERRRLEFAADAEAAWQESKESLKGQRLPEGAPEASPPQKPKAPRETTSRP